MRWRFLDTGEHPGKYNMEFDESLVRSLADGDGIPTVRVYGWHPHTISLGWNQRAEDINADSARRDGIDIVRRPTGGRAILHSEELTYSVVMASHAKNILATYNEISRALVLGLKRLGADVSLEKSQPHFPSLYQSSSSAICFSSSARYEIQINGKKLVGSAQRRYTGQDSEELVLQHGSLLLGSDHSRIIDYLNLSNGQERDRLKIEINERTIDLSTALGRIVSFEECAEAVRTGFEDAWGIRFESPNLEPAISGAVL